MVKETKEWTLTSGMIIDFKKSENITQRHFEVPRIIGMRHLEKFMRQLDTKGTEYQICYFT